MRSAECRTENPETGTRKPEREARHRGETPVQLRISVATATRDCGLNRRRQPGVVPAPTGRACRDYAVASGPRRDPRSAPLRSVGMTARGEEHGRARPAVAHRHTGDPSTRLPPSPRLWRASCGMNGIPQIRPDFVGTHLRALTACARGGARPGKTGRGTQARAGNRGAYGFESTTASRPK